jgi:quercetin dioxygenase-like cupin family protein
MNVLCTPLLKLLVRRFVAEDSASPAVTRVRLPPTGWHSIHRPRGQSIRCLAGQATVTQEGDPRDLLLVPGETFDVERDRHLYLTTDTGAELQFATSMTLSKFC